MDGLHQLALGLFCVGGAGHSSWFSLSAGGRSVWSDGVQPWKECTTTGAGKETTPKYVGRVSNFFDAKHANTYKNIIIKKTSPKRQHDVLIFSPFVGQISIIPRCPYWVCCCLPLQRHCFGGDGRNFGEQKTRRFGCPWLSNYGAAVPMLRVSLFHISKI